MSATQSFSLDEVVEALRGLLAIGEHMGVQSFHRADYDKWDAALDKARAVLAKVGDV